MSHFDRRTLVRGAAWSIPVVVIAAQAPAFAASHDAPTVGSFSVCKQPGGPNAVNCQGYRITVSLSVQPGKTWTIDLTQVNINGANLLGSTDPLQFTGVTTTANSITFSVCTNANSGDKPELTLRYTASTTGVAPQTNLGGTYALDVSRNC